MNNKFVDWLIFIALSFIWGSSFILMKEGMVGLSAYQVASVRIISSGIVLLPLAWRSFRLIPRNKIFTCFMSGVLGSLLPSYLFCMAEQVIDSALAGVLNSLTPIFVIVVGALFFRVRVSASKVAGIMVAFAGCILLFFAQPVLMESNNSIYAFMVVLATLMYGINVNMVHRNLAGIPSVNIAAVALPLNAVPALLLLYFTGFFGMEYTPAVNKSVLYSVVLGVFGTTIASVLFYILIKRAGTVFSSMVTYGIPFVAIIWGIVYGEKIGWVQVIGLLVILAGVYIANLKQKKAEEFSKA